MNFRMVRVSLLMCFVLVMLMMSWELARFQAVLADGPIPKEAIRLRILANSDSVADQVVKRKVRDVVVAQMKQWAERPLTIEQARQTIRANQPTLEALVRRTLVANGFAYGYKVELATVPFPTKMYGDKLYPAGDYEALRITLGKGAGANWWCVLFPPLCFVDAVHGVAVSQKSTKKQPTKVQVHSYFYDKIKQIGKKI
jgi:stage II sporulation protein R